MAWRALAEVIRSYSNLRVPPLRSQEHAGTADAPTLTDQAAGDAALKPSQDEPSIRTWRITGQQKQEALEVFRAGGSVGEAAQAAGMAWSTARLVLDEQIQHAGRPAPKWHQLTADEVAEARRLRAAAWAYKAIGQKFGVSRQAVRKRLATGD